MTHSKYEIFLKTAETGNITRTAERLHYTQAGVSHAIAALEKETGFALFLRSSNGVELTENGKRLLPAVQELVNQQRNLEQMIHEINGEVSGTLRVGIFSSVAIHRMPQIMREFQRRHPRVRFELRFGDYDTIAEDILHGRSDCGFLSAPAPENLCFYPLYQDSMQVLLPPRHPLAKKPYLTLAEVKREPLIMQRKGSDNDMRRVLEQDKLPFTIRHLVNDDFSVIAMVENGFGITIMPEMIPASYKGIFEMRPLQPPQIRTIGIAGSAPAKTGLLTRTFILFLTEENVQTRNAQTGGEKQDAGSL